MSIVVLHVIMAMIFQVDKVTSVPLSLNEINFDHLRYEPQDTHKVCKYIKLNIFKNEKWVEFLLL